MNRAMDMVHDHRAGWLIPRDEDVRDEHVNADSGNRKDHGREAELEEGQERDGEPLLLC